MESPQILIRVELVERRLACEQPQSNDAARGANVAELRMQHAGDTQRVNVHVSDQAAVGLEPDAHAGDVVADGVDRVGRSTAELAIDRALQTALERGC